MIKKYIMWYLFTSFIFFNIGSAGDAPLIGMGNLSLIFQNDFHKLDLYDFAGIISGFFRNDTASSAVFRGSWMRQSWADDSLIFLAVGQIIPERLAGYVPIEVIPIYDILPQLKLPPFEFIYTSRRTDVGYDVFGNELPLTSYGIYTGYSYWRLTVADTAGHHVLKAPSLFLIHSRPLSDNVDYGLSGSVFYGQFRTADEGDEISLLPLGIGAGISYHSQVLSLGVNADYYYPIFDYTHSWATGEYSYDFSGHAFSPSYGSIVQLSDITWASSLNYSWANLSGSSNDRDLGDVELIGFGVKTQLLFTPSFLRLTGYAQYGYDKPKYIDDNDETLFEIATKSLILGGGTGVTLGRLKAGIEGFYTSLIIDDRVLEDSYDANGFSMNCGAEFSLVKNLFIRGGYNYNQLDLDIEDFFVDDRITSNTFTCGLGVNLITNTRIDIAYNYALSESETLSDENITGHIITLYFKYSWVPEIW